MAGLTVNELVSVAMSMGAVQVEKELAQLAALVADLSPDNVLEIGSEAGGTFFLWCQLAKGIKISVDLPTGASGSWKYAEAQALAARTKMMSGWAGNVHVITGDSHSQAVRRSVKENLGDRLLDFLFIDGDHSYDGVKLDYEDYRGFVRPGGLIAFHDIKETDYHRRLGCHVGEFWRELTGDKKEFCAPCEWGGIGTVTN